MEMIKKIKCYIFGHSRIVKKEIFSVHSHIYSYFFRCIECNKRLGRYDRFRHTKND